MKRRTLLKAALGSAVAGSALWLTRPAGLQEFVAADLAFGTTISIKLLHTDEEQARAALSAAVNAVREVDQLMSLYRPSSQLSQLNRDGELHQADPRLLYVLQQAQALSRLSGGAFDVTVQPLWQAANGERNLKEALRQVGWQRLSLQQSHITLGAPGMGVTLNGLAQGYGADLALAALKAHGIQHALLDTGEFATLGQGADHQPWNLAIRDPRHADALAQVLAADGRFMASSGDYATTFSKDFRQHHIFDPSTGHSPLELASVSVLAPTGVLADGLSTAMMVMGPQRSLQCAQDLPGVDVLCISKSGQRFASVGFPEPLS